MQIIVLFQVNSSFDRFGFEYGTRHAEWKFLYVDKWRYKFHDYKLCCRQYTICII